LARQPSREESVVKRIHLLPAAVLVVVGEQGAGFLDPSQLVTK